MDKLEYQETVECIDELEALLDSFSDFAHVNKVKEGLREFIDCLKQSVQEYERRLTMFVSNLTEQQVNNIKSWIEALRSGEYQQSNGKLKNINLIDLPGESFCCLGVLCDITIKKQLVSDTVQWEKDEFIISLPNGEEQGEIALLPTRILQYYGLTDISGDLSDAAIKYLLDTYKDNQDIYEYVNAHQSGMFLTELNDGVNLNFNQIADVIQFELDRVIS